MSTHRVAAIAVALLAASCAARKPPAPPPPDPNIQRLADADALVGIGCYLCLKEAIDIYVDIDVGAALRPSREAPEKLFDAYLLLALREKELGLADAPTFGKAQQVLDRLPPGTRDPAWLVMAQALPPNPSISSAAQVEFLATRLEDLREQAGPWKAQLAPLVDANPIAAYLTIALECDARFGGAADPPPKTDIGGSSPIVEYRRAICRGQKTDGGAALLAREPRYVELHFFLGLRALGERRLTSAERALIKAYESLPDLPALTLTLGNVYIALEESDRAFEFYDRTLALVPDHRDGLLGKGKAASYLRRHDVALPPLDRLVELGRHLAEAHYWRAWNQFGMKNLDVAWAEVLRAKALWISGSVYKLAGLIAHARGNLDEAELNFAAAWKLSDADCEAGLYLGGVRTERSQWKISAPVSAKAADCYVAEEASIRAEIKRIEAGDEEADRKTRQVGRRQKDLEENARLQATAAFQAAAAYWNMGVKDTAATFAQRAARHEQFRERAEKMIGRLGQR